MTNLALLFHTLVIAIRFKIDDISFWWLFLSSWLLARNCGGLDLLLDVFEGYGAEGVGAEDGGGNKGALTITSIANHNHQILPLDLRPNSALKYLENIKQILLVDLLVSDVIASDRLLSFLQLDNFFGIDST